jgi:mannose-6-phosphate isomerase
VKLIPLLFEPILKPKVWGGRRLSRLNKPLPAGEHIGESWEVADLPESIAGGRSVIANGSRAGRTLHAVMEELGPAIRGRAALTPHGCFPLLIKYLDARENLSVQVHPTEEYVQQHPDAHFKSEAWVVIDAEPGSVIYKGVKPGIDAGTFAAHIRQNLVVDDLIAVPAVPGECHYLPSGTCHALGAGVLVAEVQTPSDTTFRVYDWGRTDRELHIEQALQCISFDREPEGLRAAPPFDTDDTRLESLVKTAYFEIERLSVKNPVDLEVVTNDLPEVWMMLNGAGRLETPGMPDVRLMPGITTLLPAELSETTARLEPTTVLLRITLPEPLEGLLA